MSGATAVKARTHDRAKQPVYLVLDGHKEPAEDMAVILRFAELSEAIGPNQDGRSVLDHVTRITVDLPCDSEATMDVELRGSNGLPVHVKVRVYELTVGGYALRPRGVEREDASASVLAMLTGQTPGAALPDLTAEDARRASRALQAWADAQAA